jgi:hypothetical protein
MAVRKVRRGPRGVSIPEDNKGKSKIRFGKIQRVDPEKEKQRRRDARTRKQMRTA